MVPSNLKSMNLWIYEFTQLHEMAIIAIHQHTVRRKNTRGMGFETSSRNDLVLWKYEQISHSYSSLLSQYQAKPWAASFKTTGRGDTSPRYRSVHSSLDTGISKKINWSGEKAPVFWSRSGHPTCRGMNKYRNHLMNLTTNNKKWLDWFILYVSDQL